MKRWYIIILGILAFLVVGAIISLFIISYRYRINKTEMKVDTLFYEDTIKGKEKVITSGEHRRIKLKTKEKEYEKERYHTYGIEKRYLEVETISSYDTTKALFTTTPIYMDVSEEEMKGKECIVKAYIDPKGNVVSARIFSSSGNKKFDNMAIDEVKDRFFPVYNFKIRGTYPWILVPVEGR